MASGRWNQIAQLLSAQYDLCTMVKNFGGGKAKFIDPFDLHPYRKKPRKDKLKIQFVELMQEIDRKYPREERQEARQRLIERYRKEQAKQ